MTGLRMTLATMARRSSSARAASSRSACVTGRLGEEAAATAAAALPRSRMPMMASVRSDSCPAPEDPGPDAAFGREGAELGLPTAASISASMSVSSAEKLWLRLRPRMPRSASDSTAAGGSALLGLPGLAMVSAGRTSAKCTDGACVQRFPHPRTPRSSSDDPALQELRQLRLRCKV